MDERDWLADRFEANRTHLRAVAYRMLGSLSEADDAVQEAWLRLSRAAGRIRTGGAGERRTGVVTFDPQGRPFSVMGFTVAGGKSQSTCSPIPRASASST